MQYRSICAAGLVALAAGALPGIAAAELVGNTFAGDLYSINPSTGASSTLRSTGINLLDGITTRASDGVVFGLDNGGTLYRINPTTGAPTTVGSTGFPFIEADVAYDAATGFLYGIQAFGGNVAYGVVQINPATAASTLVGSMSGVFDVSAAAFSPTGTLYALDTGATGDKLLTINKATGQVASSIAINVNLDTTAGLAFDPISGTAYVVDGNGTGIGAYNLYTLSTSTGALSLIGSTSIAGGFAGLTFTSVPEPTSFGLIAAGLALASARRKRN